MTIGDNPLTACHVAQEQHLNDKAHKIILHPPSEKGQQCALHSIDSIIILPLNLSFPKALALENILCLTGDGLAPLQAVDPQQQLLLIPHVQVFAQYDPLTKEICHH